MDKVRLGIIGLGNQGKFYTRILTGELKSPYQPDNMVIGAVCDIDPKMKAMYQEKHPELPFFEDWKEMIASGLVDAVVTTVPHYLHPEIAIYSLEHGIHVLVEKPASVAAKNVREMNEVAAKHPELTFGIMFNQRTNPLYIKVRELIKSGELGEIRRSNWIVNSWWRPDSYYRSSAWRATWGGEGGGVLVNQAPHQLDLWQWICGFPTKMTAKCINGAHRDIVTENDVTILTEYENGSTGVFITSTHDFAGTNRFEIDLSKGKIVIENNQATVLYFPHDEDYLNANITMEQAAQLTRGNAAGGDGIRTEVIEGAPGEGPQHCGVMQNFAAHILDGTPLLAPGSDGINGVRLANGAQLSSWLGKTVDMPVDEDLYMAELNKHIAQEGKFPLRK
jgi:predicted dehydrogenase